jgi:hypothetical protein
MTSGSLFVSAAVIAPVPATARHARAVTLQTRAPVLRDATANATAGLKVRCFPRCLSFSPLPSFRIHGTLKDPVGGRGVTTRAHTRRHSKCSPSRRSERLGRQTVACRRAGVNALLKRGNLVLAHTPTGLRPLCRKKMAFWSAGPKLCSSGRWGNRASQP